MKKVILVLLLAGLFIFGLESGAADQDLAWLDIARGISQVRAILLAPDEPQVIYIGTEKGIFKTDDAGLSWRCIFSQSGFAKAVNFLAGAGEKEIFACTGNGLYHSENQGQSWKRVFLGKGELEKDCVTLAVLPYGIYLGTKAGLFVSKDNGRTWQKETGELGNTEVLAVACIRKEPNYLYVACVDGVFKTQDSRGHWQKVFSGGPTESENGDDSKSQEDQDAEVKISGLRYIGIDPGNAAKVYLASANGVYRSADGGGTWDRLSNFGLLSKEVPFLYISRQSKIYALTKSGVFAYNDNRWQELSLRLAVNQINSLALDDQNNIYAACDKGLFRAQVDLVCAAGDIISVYSKNEPPIACVQEAAIKYAEVEMEKIKLWRRQAALRGLLPRVTIGMDRDRDRTVSKSIWGIYSSYSNGNITAPSRYYVGPDDETKYDNTNWNVGVTWDLADLIWNDAQTSIDVRSRLLVQLRADILDEVTKIYFERLRVKMELDNLSIEDRKKRCEKGLRLQELTAMLNALTGGYFPQFKTGS